MAREPYLLPPGFEVDGQGKLTRTSTAPFNVTAKTALELPSAMQFQALSENAQLNLAFELLERLEDGHPDHLRFVVCSLYRNWRMTLYDILVSWVTLGRPSIW